MAYPTTTPRSARLLIPAVALGLVAAACGGGSTGSDTGPDGELAAGPIEPSAGIDRAPVDPAAPVDELTAGFNDAGFDLLRDQAVGENLVFSPLSIGHALLMARGAADGETGAAIDGGFGLPDGMAAHEAWNTLDQAMSAADGVATALDGSETPIVTLADRLWPATSAEPEPEWLDLMATHHGAGVETIDTADPDRSEQRINGWVADRTNQLIPSLLPDGFIDDGTVLILTDAVYFKAQWRNVFGKYGPEPGDFTRLDGSTGTTSYLVDREQPGPRGRGDGYVGAEVPYLGDDFSMLLLVPDEGRFEEVRDRLSSDMVAEIDNTLTDGPYELRMPEWETETMMDLSGRLTEMGVAPGAYPGIGPGVSLGGAIHGAKIIVDETGTEAAAATALEFDASAADEPDLVIAADRPFLYLVRHIDSGAVLFAGQVTDPTTD